MEDTRDTLFNNQHNLPTETEVEEDAKHNGSRTFGIFKIADIEKTKFFLMAGMFFLICYNYALLRELKSTFIISRQNAASISFLKLMYVPPVSIVASVILQKFLTITTNRKILSICLMLYAVYFIAYGLLILPFQDYIEVSHFRLNDRFSDGKMSFRSLEQVLAFFVTITCWTSTLHFIAAEIW